MSVSARKPFEPRLNSPFAPPRTELALLSVSGVLPRDSPPSPLTSSCSPVSKRASTGGANANAPTDMAEVPSL